MTLRPRLTTDAAVSSHEVSIPMIASPVQSTLRPAGQAPKGGFETSVSLPGAGAGSYAQVQALDASGAVIGVSPVKRI